jgi:hypothetical protein
MQHSCQLTQRSRHLNVQINRYSFPSIHSWLYSFCPKSSLPTQLSGLFARIFQTSSHTFEYFLENLTSNRTDTQRQLVTKTEHLQWFTKYASWKHVGVTFSHLFVICLSFGFEFLLFWHHCSNHVITLLMHVPLPFGKPEYPGV